MPKLKTKKGAAKRFRVTTSGKVMRRHAGMRHLLEWKKKAKKRALRKVGRASPSDEKRVKLMLAGR